MDLTLEAASNLYWSDAAKTSLTGSVKFAEREAALPYTFTEAEWPDAWAELSSRTDIAPYQPPPPPVIVVAPADLWRRTTEAEAEAIEQAMNAQPAKYRNIFQRASSYRSDDALWPVLMGVAVQLFREKRAAELLAPSA